MVQLSEAVPDPATAADDSLEIIDADVSIISRPFHSIFQSRGSFHSSRQVQI
jgi:hypothetical protein